MKPLPSWDALQRLTAAVPRQAPGYSTNLYASPKQIEQWCAAGGMGVLVARKAVLVLRADRDFHHIYHVSRDGPALTAALLQLPVGQYTTDIIGCGDPLDQMCEAYAAAGFAHHAFLRRMSRACTPSPSEPGEGVMAAEPEDANEVAAFLDRLLDPLAEQLPKRDELGAAARAGRLLLVRQEEVTAGMLMYDIQGQLAHLRFWHVNPDARGTGIGRRLMATFLSRCAETRRIVLWVIGNNDRSIGIYRHYGFKTDGLLDRIMIVNKDQHQ